MRRDQYWLIDFRDTIVEMGGSNSSLLQRASQEWGAALGAMIRAERAETRTERKRRNLQAQSLFEAGNVFVQQWMQTQP